MSESLATAAGRPNVSTAPIGQREIVPAGHVMALDVRPAGTSTGPPKPKPMARIAVLGDQAARRSARICRRMPSAPSAGRTSARFKAVSFPLLGGAHAKLQFRAADFDAQEHDG